MKSATKRILVLVSLLLVSFNLFGSCGPGESALDCYAHEAEKDRQEMEYQSALDQQRRDFDAQLEQREHDADIERQAREREYQRMNEPQRDGARSILCAYGDNDC
jgi:hypothetical protein